MRLRPYRCPAALAFMAQGPHDIRPDLLALYYCDHLAALPRVLAYGTAYMAVWCRRNAIEPRADQERAAVAHGLLRVWRPRDARPSDERAREFGMRADTFRMLSNRAHGLYRSRLVEAATRFIEIAADSDDPGPAGTLLSPLNESSWWKPGRLAEVKSVELKVGITSPPDLPRAPPRDTGWLPSFDWAA